MNRLQKDIILNTPCWCCWGLSIPPPPPRGLDCWGCCCGGPLFIPGDRVSEGPGWP